MRGIPLFEVLDDTECVKIVVKAEAVFPHGGVEGALSGMAKRRMADIVDQRQGFGQVLIQAQGTGRGARDRRDLESVGETAAEVVGVAVGENLGFASHAPERAGVSHASAIALESAAIGMGILWV